MQKSKSNITAMTDDSLATYLQHQQAVFDEMSNFFASDDATPPQVVPAMKHLAHCILKRNENTPTTKLIDVGCGTGALFPFYLEAAKTLHIGGLQITGVDLSPKMAALARQRAENLLQSNSDHSITVTDSDFVTLMETNDEHRNAYDVVVANACFGNFFDTGTSIVLPSFKRTHIL
jgi:ubiquinone/menaquinone biosynthesis C-methylase UbiE